MAKQEKQQQSTELAQAETKTMIMVQDEVPDYIGTENRGSENVGQDDIVIPRLEIVQALSPQVKPGDPEYNEQARPGMLVNSVSGQLYGKEVYIVPIIYYKQWLVWAKRKWIDEAGREQKSEGGFYGAFNTPEEANERMAAEIAAGVNPRGIEVLDTPQHLCLLLDANTGKVEEIMMSMARTKAKISRQWNSLIRMAGGDRFARVYRVTAAMEKNKSGEDYYNFAVAQLGFPAKSLYLQAESLYKQMAAGRVVTVDVTDYTAGDVTPSSDTDAEM